MWTSCECEVEITSLRSSCDVTHSVASSPSELATSPRELRRPAAACAARRVCNEAGLVAAAEFGLLVRFFVPTAAAASLPLLLSFHGTGG